MKALRKILSAVLILVLLSLTAVTYAVTDKQNTSGGYSSATVCGEKTREYILARFGNAETPVQLLRDINDFACKNFTYKEGSRFFQYFDAEEFVFEKEFCGVCWDFACFSKVVALEVAKYKGWQDVNALVFDVSFVDDGTKHSMNFVTVGDKTYYFDNTFDNSRYNSKQPVVGVVDIGDTTVEEYMKMLGMKPFGCH